MNDPSIPAPAPASSAEPHSNRALVALALPLGLGASVAALSTFMLGWLALTLALAEPPKPDDPHEQAIPAFTLAVVAVAALVGLTAGAFTVALRNTGRLALALIGSLGIAGTVVAAARGSLVDAHYFALPLQVACAFLFRKGVARWTSEEGRARANPLGTNLYIATVFWGSLVLVAIEACAHFKEIFESMNVELPIVTQFAVDAGDWLSQLGFLRAVLFPALVFAAIPVLRVGPSMRRRATIVVCACGALSALAVVFAVVMPIVKLRAALKQ